MATPTPRSLPDSQNPCLSDECPNFVQKLQEVAKAGGLAPDLVLVMAGRNDLAFRDEAVVRAAIDRFYRLADQAYPNAQIAAIDPLGDDDPTPVLLEPMGRATAKAVRANGGTYLDIGQPLLRRPR